MAKKQDVAELVAPDPFLESASRVASWVEKHTRLLVLAVVGAALAVVAVLVLGAQKERSSAALTATFGKAVEKYQKAVELSTTATTADAKNKAFEEALPGFENLLKEHAAAPAARIAELYAADLGRRLGRLDAAEKHYAAFADQALPDDILLHLALEGAGYAAEDAKRLDQALAYFDRLGKLPDRYYRDYALMHQARILEAKGNKDDAIARYRTLLKEMTDSPLRSGAEGRLSALGAAPEPATASPALAPVAE
jgi:tetratricopeptide (TPR) repeat protein